MTEDLRKCIPLSSAAHARVLDAVETLTLALHRHCRKRSLLTFALSYFTGYHSLFRRTVVLNRFTRNFNILMRVTFVLLLVAVMQGACFICSLADTGEIVEVKNARTDASNTLIDSERPLVATSRVVT
ncbi:unnamed protein product [Peronospora belbahrii]|uniref:Uncharacterized protein n=1 Tax=Peronospora belbahrii TaxID=622444 RepID=A0AAU9KX19_9STRA|nr:unnamed protein product [Peronospora belbahrii]